MLCVVCCVVVLCCVVLCEETEAARPHLRCPSCVSSRLFYWAQKHIEDLPATVTLPYDNKVLHVRESIRFAFCCAPLSLSVCVYSHVSSVFRKCQSIQEFEGLITSPKSPPFTLNTALECFYMFQPIVQSRMDVIEDLAYYFCKRQSDCNILYTEVRFGSTPIPTPHWTIT